MSKKIYIGFAIDMDRAYDCKSRDGKPIREDHPKLPERKKHKKVFEDGMNRLFEYFKEIGAEKGVTWFVNEASFMTTKKFPDIIKKCIDTGGEIGLHTHFNSSMFKSSVYTMPENSEIWEKEGIIEPKKRLEEFLEKHNAKQRKVTVFKAGNHIRNKAMFEKLVEHGFEIDTTCMIKHIEIREVNSQFKILFNDSNINGEPFIYKTSNGEIFEIPELGMLNNENINNLTINNPKPILLRLQLHPWQVLNIYQYNDTLLTTINNSIDYVKKLDIDIEYINCQEMKNLYTKCNDLKYKNINTSINFSSIYDFENQLKYQEMNNNKIRNLKIFFYKDEIMKIIEKKISKNYLEDFLNDNSSHYKNMVKENRIFGSNDLFIINYIYNNFSKNIKCLDLFAGIGQSAIGLYNLGFNNIGLLEFDNYRINLSKKICKDNNYKINIINDDFFLNNDLYQFDLLFTNNAVASCLDNSIDKQIKIYERFLEPNSNKIIILNPEKYGTKKICYDIIKKLKEKYFVIDIGNNFYQITNYKSKSLNNKFSNFFTNYNSINNNNTKIELIEESDNELKTIKIDIKEDKKHSSFGIFFEFPIEFKKKYLYSYPITEYKLNFYAKSSKNNCKLKIYTGKKWIKLDTELSNDYQYFEINDIFDFNSRSTYRIGVQDINNISTELYIKNINLQILNKKNIDFIIG